MPITESGEGYNMAVMYHCNLRTGEIELTIDYTSPPGTRIGQHEQKHFKRVQELLERSGILKGGCRIRIRRHDVETVYDVKKEEDIWQWMVREQVRVEPQRPEEEPEPPISEVETEPPITQKA